MHRKAQRFGEISDFKIMHYKLVSKNNIYRCLFCHFQNLIERGGGGCAEMKNVKGEVKVLTCNGQSLVLSDFFVVGKKHGLLL